MRRRLLLRTMAVTSTLTLCLLAAALSALAIVDRLTHRLVLDAGHAVQLIVFMLVAANGAALVVSGHRRNSKH